MTKYKVAYIDEFPEDVREFQRFASDIFEVIPLTPIADLEELVSKIFEIYVDAVVVDHNLIEYDITSTINYQGNDVVDKLQEKVEDFPIFVLTSYDEDAIDENEDARIVFEKKIMYASKEQKDVYDSGIKFKKLIVKQIEKYKSRIEENQKELLTLIKDSQQRELNAFEKQRLKELDSKIEKALDKESQIPDILRDEKEALLISELLRKVDELAKKLENKK
ncbi:MAG TPA: hypothetical protein PLP23_07970 [Panacibacter sp.]|nr:hypothetical protein [Panacibacter sp.]